MADYRISVDTKVNTQQLDKLEQRIKSFNNKPIKVKVDLSVDGSDITRQIDRQIGGKLGVRANLDVGVDRKALNKAASQAQSIVENGMTQKFKLHGGKAYSSYLQTIAKDVQRSVDKINKLSTSKGVHGNEINNELNNLKTYVDQWNSVIDKVDVNKLSAKTKEAIAITQRNIDNLFSSFESKSLDLDWAEQVSSETAKVEASAKKLRDSLKQVYANDKKMVNLDVDSSEYKELERQNDELMSSIRQLKNELNGKIPATFLDGMREDAQKFTNDLNAAEAKAADVQRKMAQKAVGDNETVLRTKINKSMAEIEKMELKLKQLGSAGSDELTEAVGKLKQMQTGFESLNAGKIEQAAKEYKEFAEQVKHTASEVDKAHSKLKLDSFDDKLEMKRQKYKNAMDMFLKDNPKMRGSIFEKQYMKIRVDLDTGKSEQELDHLMNKARLVQQTAKVNGKTGDTLLSGLGKSAKSMMSFASVASVLYGVSDAFRMMYQNVLEVDTAMTELKRVTDLSGLQYDNLYSKLTVSAKEYGVQLTDLISATADWSRAGFDADVAAGLAEVTSVYQHIADLDYSEASENLLTAYKGFEKQLTQDFNGNAVEAVSYVADVFNELDNNYSVTAAGVGAALKRSASALQVAGNTFQESAAMVTGISEVTQDPKLHWGLA